MYMPEEHKYSGMSADDFEQSYDRRNHEPTEQEYNYKAMEQALYLGAELYDLAIRYNMSILGDMERNGVIQDGPAKHINNAIASLELLKESLIY